jgi:hypothetical protein
MSKSIDTLVQDIEETILGLNGWDSAVGEFMSKNIAVLAESRFKKPQEPRSYLSLSSLGTPCKRKLWYKINMPDTAESLGPNTLLKFFYGDVVEELVLALAVAGGHKVEGMQDKMDVHGIKGHRDAVIDGMTIDVKTASPAGFKKFKNGNLRKEDPFGYISQLSSYVYAAKDDPLVTDKKRGGFLVVDKVNGDVCLDIYDFTDEFEKKEQEVSYLKEMVAADEPPERAFEPVDQKADSPNGNKKLPFACGYCEYKKACYPNLRKFVYANGPLYLTKVVKKPIAFEDLEF